MTIAPIRAEIVRWVAESMRPFNIVANQGFQTLMKMGRPGYYIPSPGTVSRDVKQVFVKCRQRVATMLQVSTYFFDTETLIMHQVRNIQVLSTLVPTHGRPQTIRRMWLLLSILKRVGCQFRCYSICRSRTIALRNKSCCSLCEDP
jgi:hypothetical protein